MVAVLLPLVAACSGDDNFTVDVSGAYTGQVTNEGNSCPGVWVTGQTNDAQATVAQTAGDVSIQVKGGVGVLLQLGFGTNSFSGSLSGTHIDAHIIGSTQATAGTCQYTFNGGLTADLSGDTLNGTITYTPKTNNDADCSTMNIAGCSRVQNFSLNRPPKM
jgi:hypothetical protein